MITCTFNPATHVIVPIESTTKMDLAGEKVLDREEHRAETSLCWDAMIAAAPEYPADASWISVDERLPYLLLMFYCILDQMITLYLDG
jgi:hypothetical protein